VRVAFKSFALCGGDIKYGHGLDDRALEELNSPLSTAWCAIQRVLTWFLLPYAAETGKIDGESG
jgi:hypothetical protein